MLSRRILTLTCRHHVLLSTMRFAVKQHMPTVSAAVFSTSTFSSKDQQVSMVLQKRIELGCLRDDHAQAVAARRLNRLQEALVGYSNEPLIRWIEEKRKQEEELKKKRETSNEILEMKEQICFNRTNDASADELLDEKPDIRVPRGLFLHGHVGTGKSMLMDLFYAHVQIERKRRVHFHSFLQDVHARIHQLKQHDLSTNGRDFHVDTSINRNPITRVAKQLAKEVSVLCFDEFQVTDVADALIMKQLFEVLFQHGTIVVATSNRPPSDLYEGGLNRSYFLPFIDLLRKYCIIHEIQSETDYRQLLSQEMQDCFLVDSGTFEDSRETIDSIFDGLLGGMPPIAMNLAVNFNRSISVPQAHPNGMLVGRFQFDDLCDRELGSSDYRAIAEQFSVVIVERIPLLTLTEHDQARRFITLIDELYEGKCALVCSAIADPSHLFVDRHISQKAPDPDSIETKVGEMFGIDAAQSTGRSVEELASVRELSFAFRRAASRLTEMCSRSWWDKATAQSNVL